jgi:hypothetical protein
MPLKVHCCGWIGQIIPRSVLRDQTPQFVAGHEELASERVGKPLSTAFRAEHRDDDVKAARVEESMRHLVREGEDLAA